MGYAYVTVTDQSGAIDLAYAEITWSGTSGSTTVYVTIEGVYAAGASWRIKKGSSTYAQGQGIGDWTFTGTIGQTYQLQVVDPNTNNWAWYGGNFTLKADSSGGGDDGGDDDDDGGDSSYYIYYSAGTGTSLSVDRTWNETTGESYEGKIYSGTEIAWKDHFYVVAKPLTGYQDVEVAFTNFDITGETVEDDGSIIYTGKMDTAGDIIISSSATLIPEKERVIRIDTNGTGFDEYDCCVYVNSAYRLCDVYHDNGSSWTLL